MSSSISKRVITAETNVETHILPGHELGDVHGAAV